jgi:hypothetical protein
MGKKNQFLVVTGYSSLLEKIEGIYAIAFHAVIVFIQFPDFI